MTINENKYKEQQIQNMILQTPTTKYDFTRNKILSLHVSS